MPRKPDPEARRLRAEHQALKNAVADLFAAWAELESALAILFSVILTRDGAQQAGLAVYFAPSNMETRLKMVDVALTIVLRPSKHKAEIMPIWITVLNAIGRMKNTRNQVAHGCTMMIGDRHGYGPRISAPRFHHEPVFKAVATGQKYGLTASDISHSAERVYVQVAKLHDLASAMLYVQNDDVPSLRETLARLKAHPRTSAPRQVARKRPARKRLPPPSEA